MAKNDFQYGGWNSYTLQCGMWLQNRSGSTLRCDTWLWDDMPLNSPKTSAILEFYIWFRFRPHHHSRRHSAPVSENLSKLDHPRQKKNDVMSIFKMADLRHLGFQGPIMGSLKSRCTTSYRSSIDITLHCLVFLRKSRFFCILVTDRHTNKQTDKQTDGQHRCTKPLSLSRAAA